MKIKKAVGQLIVMILFLSCRNPTGNIDGQSQNTNYDLMKVSTTISKSIFTASYDYQSEMTDDSLIDWNVLYQIQSDGSYSEIIFKNDEDQDIRLNITKIVDISPGLIGIEYSQVQNIDSLSVTNSIKKAIIRTSDSFAFDFSEYDLNKALAYKEYLYIEKEKTLYMINIATMTSAVPLNNSSYDPMPEFMADFERLFYVTEDYDVLFSRKVFFFDTSHEPIEYNGIQIVHPTNPSLIMNPRFFIYEALRRFMWIDAQNHLRSYRS